MVYSRTRVAGERRSSRPHHFVPIQTLRLDPLYRIACCIGICDDHQGDRFSLGTSARSALGQRQMRVTLIHTSSQHTLIVDKPYPHDLRHKSEQGTRDSRKGTIQKITTTLWVVAKQTSAHPQHVLLVQSRSVFDTTVVSK